MTNLSEVQFHREKGYILTYSVVAGVVCHQCGSGEVVSPLQTMDLPMVWECLNCGRIAACEKFDTAAEVRDD